jgi:DNA modification methylase
MEDIKAWWVRWATAGGYSHEEHVAVAKALEKQGKASIVVHAVPGHQPQQRHLDGHRTDANAEHGAGSTGEEMHVCPLQLDIIKRLITRYTNKGDIVLDPLAEL